MPGGLDRRVAPERPNQAFVTSPISTPPGTSTPPLPSSLALWLQPLFWLSQLCPFSICTGPLVRRASLQAEQGVTCITVA